MSRESAGRDYTAPVVLLLASLVGALTGSVIYSMSASTRFSPRYDPYMIPFYAAPQLIVSMVNLCRSDTADELAGYMLFYVLAFALLSAGLLVRDKRVYYKRFLIGVFIYFSLNFLRLWIL